MCFSCIERLQRKPNGGALYLGKKRQNSRTEIKAPWPIHFTYNHERNIDYSRNDNIDDDDGIKNGNITEKNLEMFVMMMVTI